MDEVGEWRRDSYDILLARAFTTLLTQTNRQPTQLKHLSPHSTFPCRPTVFTLSCYFVSFSCLLSPSSVLLLGPQIPLHPLSTSPFCPLQPPFYYHYRFALANNLFLLPRSFYPLSTTPLPPAKRTTQTEGTATASSKSSFIIIIPVVTVIPAASPSPPSLRLLLLISSPHPSLFRPGKGKGATSRRGEERERQGKIGNAEERAGTKQEN